MKVYHVHFRGHLKSSHIADKRKNFHMALYPLPPDSNESLIDNGRSVDGYVHYPRSSPQPAQTMPSVSRGRDASLKPSRSASIAK